MDFDRVTNLVRRNCLSERYQCFRVRSPLRPILFAVYASPSLFARW